MSKHLPAPLAPAQRRERPGVIVLGRERALEPARGSGMLARLALQLTPDVLRVVERSLAARRQPARAASAVDERVYTEGVQFSEIEYDARLPWTRKVTVRTATAWTVSAPAAQAAPEGEFSARLRRAGLLGVGGAAAIAALGLLAKGGLSTAPGGWRRRNGR